MEFAKVRNVFCEKNFPATISISVGSTVAIGMLLVGASSSCVLADTVAYTGARIETVGKAGTIDNGTVIVTDGKIADVGKDVAIPDTAKIVDVSGQTIIPGLVEVYHAVSIGGTGSTPSTRFLVIGGRTFRVGNSTSTSSTAFMRVADNLDPLTLKSDLRRLSRVGIGFANLVTRGYGQSVHAKIDPTDPESIVQSGNGYLYLALTNSTTSLNVLRSGLEPNSSGKSRTRSSAPAATRSRTGSTTSSTSKTGRTTTSSSSLSPATALWKDIREGKKPLMINVNNAATILHVVDILKKHDKVQVVLVTTGANAFQAFNALKKQKNLSVVIRPAIDTIPFTRNRVNVAKMLHDAKIKFGFTVSSSSDVTGAPDTPLFPLAMLVKTGLPRDVALKAVTLTPALLLGLDKTLGSIEKGKSANMIFVDGDPLDASSQIQRVLVQGKTTHEN
jgi:imidazolonepropionase-like amidohydrolase